MGEKLLYFKIRLFGRYESGIRLLITDRAVIFIFYPEPFIFHQFFPEGNSPGRRMDRLQGRRNMAGAQDTHIGRRIFLLGNRQMDDHFPAGPEVTFFDFKSRLYVDVILQAPLFLELANGFTPEFGCPGGLRSKGRIGTGRNIRVCGGQCFEETMEISFSPLRKIKSILPAVSSVRNSSSVKEGMVSRIRASAWG